MKTFKRQVSTYIAICREVREDDGTAQLSATRLVGLTLVIGALLWLIMALTFGAWVLWRFAQKSIRLTRTCRRILTPHLHLLETALLLTWIGLKSFAWGISPPLIRCA